MRCLLWVKIGRLKWLLRWWLNFFVCLFILFGLLFMFSGRLMMMVFGCYFLISVFIWF